MLRRVQSATTTTSSSSIVRSSSASSVLAVATTAPQSLGSIRNYFDSVGHQAQALYMDRKDLENMYPTRKPKVVAGEYGYQRHTYWNMFLSPNPCIRMPHERRRLNPKKAEVVTVFGATGFLGVEICRALLEIPEIKKVRACTRYPMSIKPGTQFYDLLENADDRLELHECDVTDRIQVNVAANGADTLIHAVDFHMEYVGNSHLDVFNTGATNVAWTARNVRSERVIFCSGMDSTFASESNYVDMRARGEEATTGNFPDATILRFGPMYGKNYRYRGPGKFVYPCVFPTTRCQPLWVVDAARAVARCARASRAVRYKFDLGGPENITHLEYAQLFARHYHPRVVFPFPKSVAYGTSKLMQWFVPNPWFDDNLLLTWELDQTPRSPAMFDRLGNWERLHYTPHSMKQAADIEFGRAQIEPFDKLQAEYDEIEKLDSEKFAAEEEAALHGGIHRAKAEPGHGRSDGMETLAQEIYPGHQFRIRKLEDAKYPDTVKDPFPNSAH